MKNNHKHLHYSSIANSNHIQHSKISHKIFAHSAIAETNHRQYRTKLGFTIAELSLATAFISVLLITIAVLIVHMSSTFQKGITMKSVDTMGQTLSDNFSRTIAASSGSVYNTTNASSFYKQWVTDSSVTITNTSNRTFNGTGVVPTHGEFHAGDYTYIWNTGYVLDENKDIYKDESGKSLNGEQVKVRDESPGGKEYTNFRLLRIKGNYTLDESTGDNTYYVTSTPLELLPASESALAIYTLQIFSAAYDANTQHAYVSGSFILGTVRGGIDINTNTNFCTDAPANLSTDFSYCAVNKFSFGTRTGISKDTASNLGTGSSSTPTGGTVVIGGGGSTSPPSSPPSSSSPSTPPKTIFDITYMQDMTPEVCAATTTPSRRVMGFVDDYYIDRDGTHASLEASKHFAKIEDFIPETTLIDARDNRTYIVRKMPDGHCWMVQNLDLFLVNDGNNKVAALDVDGVTKRTLTKDNTNISEDYWAPTTINETQTQDEDSVPWRETGLSDDQIFRTMRSYDNGDIWMRICSSSGIDPVGYHWNWSWIDNITAPDDPTSKRSEDASCYYSEYPGIQTMHFGNYYNWFTATAGTSPNTRGEANASGSICPKGWILPKGVNTAVGSYEKDYTFEKLYYSVGSSAITRPPKSEPASGFYRDDGVLTTLKGNEGIPEITYGVYVDHGHTGNFWTSTASNQNIVRVLRFSMSTNNDGYVDENLYKSYDIGTLASNGLSVRCVAL